MDISIEAGALMIAAVHMGAAGLPGSQMPAADFLAAMDLGSTPQQRVTAAFDFCCNFAKSASQQTADEADAEVEGATDREARSPAPTAPILFVCPAPIV